MGKAKKSAEVKWVGLSGYLVLLRHTMDDLPVRLFPHTTQGKRESLVFAGSLDPIPSREIRSVFKSDCSTPVCAAVIEFLDGEPVNVIGSIEF